MAKVIYTNHNQLITKGTYTMRNKVISLVAVAVAAGTIGAASSQHHAAKPVTSTVKAAASVSPSPSASPTPVTKPATSVGAAAVGGKSNATPTPTPIKLQNNPRF